MHFPVDLIDKTHRGTKNSCIKIDLQHTKEPGTKRTSLPEKQNGIQFTFSTSVKSVISAWSTCAPPYPLPSMYISSSRPLGWRDCQMHGTQRLMCWISRQRRTQQLHHRRRASAGCRTQASMCQTSCTKHTTFCESWQAALSTVQQTEHTSGMRCVLVCHIKHPVSCCMTSVPERLLVKFCDPCGSFHMSLSGQFTAPSGRLWVLQKGLLSNWPLKLQCFSEIYTKAA